MAKVRDINDGLKTLKSKLNGTNDRALIDAVKMVAHGQQVIVGALNNLERRDELTKGTIKRILAALSDASADVVKATFGATNSKDIAMQLARIESDLTKVPRTFPTPQKLKIPDHSKALKAIETSLKKLPTSETDLSELSEALQALLLRHPESVKEDLTRLSKQLERPKEWKFDFADFNNGTGEVIATEI